MDSLTTSLWDNLTEKLSESQKNGLVYRCMLSVSFHVDFEAGGDMAKGFITALRMSVDNPELVGRILDKCNLNLGGPDMGKMFGEQFGDEAFEDMKKRLMSTKGLMSTEGIPDSPGAETTSEEISTWLSNETQS